MLQIKIVWDPANVKTIIKQKLFSIKNSCLLSWRNTQNILSWASLCKNQEKFQCCFSCSFNPTFWASWQLWNLQIVVAYLIVFQLFILRFLNIIPGCSINITSQCTCSATHLLKLSLTDTVLNLVFITIEHISNIIHLLFPPRKQILLVFILTPVQLSTFFPLEVCHWWMYMLGI